MGTSSSVLSLSEAMGAQVRFVLLALIVLAVPSLAAVEKGTLASLEVAAIRLPQNTTLSGEIRALELKDDWAAPGEPAFYLVANSIDLEVDHEDGQSVAFGSPAPRFWKEQAHWDAVSLETLNVNASYQLHLFPLPGFPAPRITTDGASLVRAQASGMVSSTAYVNPEWRNPPGTSIKDALAWTPASTTNLRIDGDFLLTLWDWDAMVIHVNGTSILETGFETYPQDSNVPIPPAVLGTYHSRQAYLRVTGGILELAGAHPADMRLFLGESVFSAEGSTRLTNASGWFSDGPGTREIQAGNLDLRGNLRIDAAMPVEGRIPVTLHGNLEQALLGAESLLWVAPYDPQSIRLDVVYWIGGTLAVAAIATWLGWRLRLRLDEQRMVILDNFMMAKDHEAVLRLADRLVASRHFGIDARQMKARALLGLGRVEEATKILAAERDGGPAWEILQARAKCMGGRYSAAIKQVQSCLARAPEFWPEILADDIFAPILSRLSPPATATKAADSEAYV